MKKWLFLMSILFILTYCSSDNSVVNSSDNNGSSSSASSLSSIGNDSTLREFVKKQAISITNLDTSIVEQTLNLIDFSSVSLVDDIIAIAGDYKLEKVLGAVNVDGNIITLTDVDSNQFLRFYKDTAFTIEKENNQYYLTDKNSIVSNGNNTFSVKTLVYNDKESFTAIMLKSNNVFYAVLMRDSALEVDLLSQMQEGVIPATNSLELKKYDDENNNEGEIGDSTKNSLENFVINKTIAITNLDYATVKFFYNSNINFDSASLVLDVNSINGDYKIIEYISNGLEEEHTDSNKTSFVRIYKDTAYGIEQDSGKYYLKPEKLVFINNNDSTFLIPSDTTDPFTPTLNSIILKDGVNVYLVILGNFFGYGMMEMHKLEPIASGIIPPTDQLIMKEDNGVSDSTSTEIINEFYSDSSVSIAPQGVDLDSIIDQEYMMGNWEFQNEEIVSIQVYNPAYQSYAENYNEVDTIPAKEYLQIDSMQVIIIKYDEEVLDYTIDGIIQYVIENPYIKAAGQEGEELVGVKELKSENKLVLYFAEEIYIKKTETSPYEKAFVIIRKNEYKKVDSVPLL